MNIWPSNDTDDEDEEPWKLIFWASSHTKKSMHYDTCPVCQGKGHIWVIK